MGLSGVVFLSYYIALCAALRKWNSTFSRFWLCAGALFLALAATVKEGHMQALILGVLAAFLVLFLWTAGRIVRGRYPKEEKEYAYLIVLGAHVQGKRVTDSLARRLECAAEYAKEHPETSVIVSGGQGTGEEIPEAEAMERYLVAGGISKERILKESLSKTTEQNLKFSMELVDGMAKPVAVVSNDFHVYRAVCYAKKLGYRDVSPMAAGTKPLLLPNYIVRECFGIWKLWLRA